MFVIIQGYFLIAKEYKLEAGESIKEQVNISIIPNTHQHEGVQKRRLPQAIIFGVKKCGTGALISMIDLHPKVRNENNKIIQYSNFHT